MCDGRTVTVGTHESSVGYTLTDIGNDYSTNLIGNNDWSILPGSTIAYVPPSGTKRVIYRFSFNVSPNGRNDPSDEHSTYIGNQNKPILFTSKLCIDDQDVLTSRSFHSVFDQWDNTFHLEYILDVDSPSEVIANGKLSNWTSPKTLKIKLKCAYIYHSSYGATASSFYTHILKFWADSYDDYNNYYGVVSSENEKIIKPNLIIQAIGDESGSSDTKFGQTLEVISGVCDGQNCIRKRRGISYTLENVAAYNSLSDPSIYYFQNFSSDSSSQSGRAWKKLFGSEISYLPPSGTQQIIYTFSFHISSEYTSSSDNSYDIIFSSRLIIDDQDVTKFNNTNTIMIQRENTVELEYILDIGTEDNIDCEISFWTSPKTLKIELKANSDEFEKVFIHIDLNMDTITMVLVLQISMMLTKDQNQQCQN